MPTPADLNRGIRLAHDALGREAPAFEETYARALRSLAAEVASALTSAATAAIWSGPEPAAMIAELRRRFTAGWMERFAAQVERMRRRALRVTLERIGGEIGVSFDITNPMLEGVLREVANRTDLPETAWTMVGESLQRSYDEGEGIPEAARRLRTTAAAVSPLRARTIARTELVAISNAGSLAAARLSGAGEWKTWLATADARTRDWHSAASGQTRRLNDTFTVKGEEMDYPGDPRGSAENVINCRCTWLAADGPEGYQGPFGPSALLAGGGMAVGGCGCST